MVRGSTPLFCMHQMPLMYSSYSHARCNGRLSAKL